MPLPFQSVAQSRQRARTAAAGALALAAAWAGVATATATAAAADAAAGTAGPPSLEDLAASYVRFERTVAARSWPAEAIDIADRAGDVATAAFFARRPDRAATAMDDAVLDLVGSGAGDEGSRGLVRLRARDAIGGEAAGRTIIFRFRGSDPPASFPAAATVHVVPDRPVARDEDPLAGSLASGLLDATDPPRVLLDRTVPDARHRLVATWMAGEPPARRVLDLGPWTVSGRSLDIARRELQSRLDAIAPNPARAEARSLVTDRLQRLTDTTSSADATAFALDRVHLREQLEQEIAALARDEDPHRGQPGHWWYRLPVDAARWPVRVYAPAAVVGRAPSEPAPPLLVALHGAGGNEHLFVDGHAGGRLVRLADQEGFLLVCPPTTALAVGGRLESLLESIGRRYRYDPDRVLLIGHSLGAMTAGALAGLEPDRVAAAALLAGAPTPVADPPGSTPALLYVAAERDAVIPPRRVRAAAERVRAAGVAVTVRAVDRGHLLMVDAALDEAVRWLLDRVEAREP